MIASKISKAVHYLSFMAIALALPSYANAVPLVDCNAVKSIDNRENFKADDKDVATCIGRAADPPKEWRYKDGKSGGVKADGAGGFSYGGAAPPEAAAGGAWVPGTGPGTGWMPPKNAVGKANRGPNGASVPKKVMQAACSFPPPIKLSSGGVSIAAGSCWDFLNGLIKEKPADPLPPTPLGIDPTMVCPAEVDNTGIYGDKQVTSAGGLFPTGPSASCGGMLPMTISNITLNRGADRFIATEEGYYAIFYYRKVGANFTGTVSPIKLPSYLCRPKVNPDGTVIWVKSVDLTAPIVQMITYNPSMGKLSIRLKSRAAMPGNFMPPYDPNVPENYLNIPLAIGGGPITIPDCADELKYYGPPVGRRDIEVIASPEEGCNQPEFAKTANFNIYKNPMSGTYQKVVTNCPAGTVFVPDGPLVIPPTKAGGKCSGAIAVPNVSGQFLTCPYTAYQGRCKNQVTGADIGAAPCPSNIQVSGLDCVDGSGNVLGAAVTQDTGVCSSAASSPSNCNTMSMNLSGACTGKMQFAVLDRPNLHYPPGTLARLYPIVGRTSLVADSLAGTTLYTYNGTDIFLEKTAPPLMFYDGGQIFMPGGNILIMSASAQVTASSRTVIMGTGGKLTTSGGTQIMSFAPGGSYVIPGSGRIQVASSHSMELPQGFIYVTMPKMDPAVDIKTPYIRQPIDIP